MKKTLTTLLLAAYTFFSYAQSSDADVNAFFEKLNNRLNSIKAADYQLTRTITTGSNTANPTVDVCEGYFEMLPSDQISGCKWFIQDSYNNLMYDGKSVYSNTFSELYTVDAQKYKETALSLISAKQPMVFHDLVIKFITEYGFTAELIKENKETFKARVTISEEKNGDQALKLITCQKYIDVEGEKEEISCLLYVTNEYLPIKQVRISKTESEVLKEEFIIEKYNLQDSLPVDKFKPSVLGKYDKKYRYQGEAKGWVEDKKV